MKRNILARRAASAALAACMMFSLSAPALAASTDALLQQSTAAKSAVSVLDEENGMQVDEIVQDFNIINHCLEKESHTILCKSIFIFRTWIVCII